MIMVMLNRNHQVVIRPTYSPKWQAIWYNPLLARAIAEECKGVGLEFIQQAIQMDTSHNITQMIESAKVLQRGRR